MIIACCVQVAISVSVTDKRNNDAVIVLQTYFWFLTPGVNRDPRGSPNPVAFIVY